MEIMCSTASKKKVVKNILRVDFENIITPTFLKTMCLSIITLDCCRCSLVEFHKISTPVKLKLQPTEYT